MVRRTALEEVSRGEESCGISLSLSIHAERDRLHFLNRDRRLRKRRLGVGDGVGCWGSGWRCGIDLEDPDAGDDGERCGSGVGDGGNSEFSGPGGEAFQQKCREGGTEKLRALPVMKFAEKILVVSLWWLFVPLESEESLHCLVACEGIGFVWNIHRFTLLGSVVNSLRILKLMQGVLQLAVRIKKP